MVNTSKSNGSKPTRNTGPRRQRGKASGPIGFDLGTRCIKMVQFRSGADGGVTLVAQNQKLPTALGQDWRADLDGLVGLVKQMIRSGKFIGRRVVGCIPDGLIEYRRVRLNRASGPELASAVQAHVNNELNLPVDEFKTQFFDAGAMWMDDERRQEVIAMAAPISVISDLLTVFQRSGLSPVGLDAIPAALGRSVGPAVPDDAPRLVVDVGYACTTVLVIRGGHEIRFVKRMNAGLKAIDQVLADKVQVSVEQAEGLREALARATAGPDEGAFGAVGRVQVEQAMQTAVDQVGNQLVREISKCVQYYGITFREGKPEAGLILGGGAAERGLVKVLDRGSAVNFQPAQTLTDLDWVRSLDTLSARAPAGSWAVAAGLAMYVSPGQQQGAAA